jgi:predicted DNA-binding ribbon-helix-helix protein
MKSLIVKRSVIIDGHKTSMSLEDEFWQGLKTIAAGRHMPIAGLVDQIDRERRQGNLSSAVRLFVLEYYRNFSSGKAINVRARPLMHDAAVRAPCRRSVDDGRLRGWRERSRNPVLKRGHLRRGIPEASRGIPYQAGAMRMASARKAGGGSDNTGRGQDRCQDRCQEPFHDLDSSLFLHLPS